MTRAVIFDVGRVLIEWDIFALYRKLLPNDEEIAAFIDEVGLLERNLEFDRGLAYGEGIPQLAEKFPHRADLIYAFDERWEETVPGAIDGSVDILRELGASGIALYAITNFAKEKWQLTIARFPFLSESFRDIAVSGLEGVIKPEPEIYRRLLKRNNLIADQCVFIDDSPTNVEGARRIGIDAILFEDPQGLRRDLIARGLPLAAPGTPQ